jgi:hypothetical protein
MEWEVGHNKVPWGTGLKVGHIDTRHATHSDAGHYDMRRGVTGSTLGAKMKERRKEYRSDTKCRTRALI